MRLAPEPTAMLLQALASVVELTWRLMLEEVLWPGLGLLTETAKMPTAEAVPVAVSWVRETNVVASGRPARRICEWSRKLPPVTVRFTGPTRIAVGVIEVRRGVGLSKVTLLTPKAEESAELVAWTATALALGREAGAA